jgi:AGCS family alanine or glycine:cation symporter
MRKLIFLLMFVPQVLFAENTIGEQINLLFEPIVRIMAQVIFWQPFSAGIPIVVIWLVIGAVFFTFRMNFISVTGFKHALQLVRGDYDNPNDKGEVTRFQALTTALSATVGLGNIAGVAVAVAIGGPGATFWMIVAGLLGMSSKFVECTLGVKYRKIDAAGVVSGGPMYYLKTAFEQRKLPYLGKVMAGLFAILCVGGSFGGGNMFQANQAFSQLEGQFSVLEGNGVYFGCILALLVGVVIIGGIKTIANVTEKIVPFMAVLYVGASLFIIVVNYDQVFDVFGLIFDAAFSGEAAKGGFIGVLVQGFRRAAFSNEAGVGSAAIAHSAVKTNEPVTEGIVALLEPFIDTVVICTMTALVIVITGRHTGYDLEGAQLTSSAFESVISWFPLLLVVAIFLFAFSTMISWSYYGLKAWTYLFGSSKFTEFSYKFLFLIFIIIGSSVSLGAVIDFSDMMILAMAFPNILGLYMMSGEVRADLRDYISRVKSGKVKRFK